MATETTFDPIWNEIYGQGRQANRYPWDAVVSFVYHFAPTERDRGHVKILEMGCGAGNNLWFASREGFSVTGIDASEPAIAMAKKRFEEDGLTGEFKVADFTSLPLEDDSFDLAIDRAAITNCGYNAGAVAIGEVKRVLKPSGVFLFSPYAAGHSSQTTGRPGPDGVVLDISGGNLVGVGQICFYDESQLRSTFAQGWKLVSMRQLTAVDKVAKSHGTSSEWHVVAQKL